MQQDISKKIQDLLISIDPMGIYFEEDQNKDEYNEEVNLIINNLKAAKNPTDLTEIIWDIFKKRFGEIEAGGKLKYNELSNKIWKLIVLRREQRG